jgi:hypothetical protein
MKALSSQKPAKNNNVETPDLAWMRTNKMCGYRSIALCRLSATAYLMLNNLSQEKRCFPQEKQTQTQTQEQEGDLVAM